DAVCCCSAQSAGLFRVLFAFALATTRTQAHTHAQTDKKTARYAVTGGWSESAAKEVVWYSVRWAANEVCVVYMCEGRQILRCGRRLQHGQRQVHAAARARHVQHGGAHATQTNDTHANAHRANKLRRIFIIVRMKPFMVCALC